MKNYKVLLAICAAVMLALAGGMLCVQFLSPPYPQPVSDYTQQKASGILQYYEPSSAETGENGEIPLEIYGVTVELSDYEKATENGYTSYFYCFDRYGKLVRFTSDGKRADVASDPFSTKDKALMIDGLYDEFDSFSRIVSNLEYDVPSSSDTVKVYLNTNKGTYLREYTKYELAGSAISDTVSPYTAF